MEDKRYTDLDKFFRKQLHHSDENSGQWNVPPDHLFGEAMSRIDQDKDDRKKRWIGPLVGLLFVLLLSSLGLLLWQNRQLTIEIEQSRYQVEESNKVIAEIREELLALKSSQPSEASTVQSPSTDSQEITTDQANREKQVSSWTETVSSRSDRLNPSTVISSIDDLARTTEIQSNKQISEKRDYGSSITPLHFLPKTMSSITRSDEIMLTPPPFKRPVTDNRSSWQWYLGLRTHFPALNMKGLTDLSPDLTKYDGRYPGYSIEIGIDHSLGEKWQLHYRLGYLKFANESLFKQTEMYDENQERVDNQGNTNYTAQLTIASPVDDLSTAVIFPVDAYAIKNNESYENITRIQDKYSFFTLSTLAGFDLLSSDRWQLSLLAGPQLLYMRSIDQDMDVQLYYKSQMMKNEIIERQASKEVNPWSLGLRSELTVAFQATPELSIGLSGGLSRSITPVNVPKTGTSPRTYIRDLYAGITCNMKI